jgi:CheY-like chemotaxis protein
MNSATPTGSLRILVVDDVADAADSLALLVGLWGYEARVARDGPAALTSAAAFRPHVVLLDVIMPGMSGGEVAGHLRQCPDLEGAVLVATTANNQDDPRLAAYNGLFNHFLRKPYNLARLEQLLGSCVPHTPHDDLAPPGTAAGP